MSLIAWYPLNGDTNDYSGNNHNGINYGTTINNSGKIGKCYSFSASSQYIQASSVNFDNNISIAGWGYATSNTANMMLFSFDSSSFPGCDLFFSSSTICWNIGDSVNNPFKNNGVNVSQPSLNTWHHYCVINNASTNKTILYVDGYYYGEAVYKSTYQSNRNFIIGNYSSTKSYAWVGKINDIRIYNHILSEKEIYELSKAKILHYKFDDFQEPTINEALATKITSNYANLMDITTPAPLAAPVNSQVYHIKSGNYGGIDFNVGNIAAGEKFSISFYVYNKAVGHCEFNLQIDSTEVNNEGKGTLKFDNQIGWNLVKYENISFTTARTNCLIRIEDALSSVWTNSDNECWYCGVQFERKDHATPFVNDSRTGIITDCSGYGHNGTFSSKSPKWVNNSVIGNGSYWFNGTENYIDCGDVYMNTDQLTICYWEKWENQGSQDGPVLSNCPTTGWGDTNSFSIGHGWSNSNYLGFGNVTLSNFASGKISDGNWHLITCVYNVGSPVTVYQDGVVIATGANATNYIISSTEHLKIGRAVRGGYFKGTLDDVRIYMTALSIDDINLLYQTRVSLDKNGNLFVQQLKEANPLGSQDNPARSAKDILDSGYSFGDGIYWILPDGDSTAIPVYCDMTTSGGGWTRVFYHDNKAGTVFFTNSTEATETNVNYPKGVDKYSILSKLENFRRPGNAFEFMLKYPVQLPGQTNIWKQTSNPITSGVETVTGYLAGSLSWTTNNFGGIAKSDASTSTFLDCEPGNGSWYYAIGCYTLWSGAMPGPSGAVTVAELYVREVIQIKYTAGPTSSGVYRCKSLSEVGPADGLTGWWKLNGDVLDYSGSGNNAINTGAVISTGIKGLCYNFTGTTNYLKFNNNIVLNQIGSTLSFWMNVNSTSNMNIFGLTGSTGSQSLIEFRGTSFYGETDVNCNDFDSPTFPTSVVIGQWNHFVLKFDKNKAYWYMNGILFGEAIYYGTLNCASTPNTSLIGNLTLDYVGSGGYSGYLNAKLSDIRYYNRALTDQEINILYKIGQPNALMQISNDGILYLNGEIREV